MPDLYSQFEAESRSVVKSRNRLPTYQYRVASNVETHTALRNASPTLTKSGSISQTHTTRQFLSPQLSPMRKRESMGIKVDAIVISPARNQEKDRLRPSKKASVLSGWQQIKSPGLKKKKPLKDLRRSFQSSKTDVMSMLDDVCTESELPDPSKLQNQLVDLDRMLAKLPDVIKLNTAIVESFNRIGRLQLADFRKIANEHKLRGPSDDDQWTLKQKKDEKGNVEVGQFDKFSDERCGIIRKISVDGNMLIDQVMFGEKTYGLSRQFRAPKGGNNGIVAFRIFDKNGRIITEKKFPMSKLPIA